MSMPVRRSTSGKSLVPGARKWAAVFTRFLSAFSHRARASVSSTNVVTKDVGLFNLSAKDAGLSWEAAGRQRLGRWPGKVTFRSTCVGPCSSSLANAARLIVKIPVKFNYPLQNFVYKPFASITA